MSKTLLYAVVLALSTPVFAAESEQTTPADDAHAQFMKIDANHDGVIDRKEAKGDTALNQSFRKLAKNGKLDEKGYDAWKNSLSQKQGS